MESPLDILLQVIIYGAVAFLIWTSFFVVKQKTGRVVEFLGKYSFTAKVGLSIKGGGYYFDYSMN